MKRDTNNGAEDMKKQSVTCPKCNGRGIIEAFLATANGTCFMCAGNGTIEIDAISDEKLRRQIARMHEFNTGRYELRGEDISGYQGRFHELADAVRALRGFRFSIHPSNRATCHPGEIWDHAEGRLVTRGDVRRAGIEG
jgi:hypothetical protein